MILNLNKPPCDPRYANYPSVYFRGSTWSFAEYVKTARIEEINYLIRLNPDSVPSHELTRLEERLDDLVACLQEATEYQSKLTATNIVAPAPTLRVPPAPTLRVPKEDRQPMPSAAKSLTELGCQFLREM